MNSDEQIASDLSARIQLLCNFDVGDLKDEMRELKQALMDNPAACSLLRDEDIGILVSSLTKILGKEVMEKEQAPARKKKEKQTFTKEELANAEW